MKEERRNDRDGTVRRVEIETETKQQNHDHEHYLKRAIDEENDDTVCCALALLQGKR